MLSEAMEKYLACLKGAAFIERTGLLNGFLKVQYYKSYEDFRKAKPQTNITEEDYNNYFNTGDQVRKILIGEPARLLREFPDLYGVSMELHGKKFIMDRNNFNKLIGLNIEELSTKDSSWIENFANRYIYNKNNRELLFKQVSNFSNDLLKIEATEKMTVKELLEWLNKAIEEKKIKINSDGSIIHVITETISKEETIRSKVVLFIFQGALRAISERIMDKFLDSEVVNYIKEFFQ